MDDERIIEPGQHLSEELAREQQREGRGRWRSPVKLRARIVAYAVACSADGESHRRLVERLGMTKRPLSRWIRKARQAGADVRQVAIVPAEHRSAPPAHLFGGVDGASGDPVELTELASQSDQSEPIQVLEEGPKMRQRLLVTALVATITIFSNPSFGQAIIGTVSAGNLAIVFPTPGTGLPTPTATTVTGMPSGAQPQGVAYYGSDNALISDFGHSRVEVVKISTASVLDVIPTTGNYDGTGTIAVAPGLNFALANGNSTTLAVIAAPFTASSTITTVTLPGSIAGYQTQAIVFDNAGRCFVYHNSGISVLDPPYTAITFTIPVSNGSSGALAITPDGNTLLATDLATANIRIFSAPFSALSTPATLSVTGASSFDGIAVTPDGSKALAADFGGSKLFAISSPFSASSAFEQIPMASAQQIEDVGISADGQLAILAGGDSNSPVPFIKAPFTNVGATAYDVTITGGRGAGAVRFLPPGLAPGLTISKAAPATVSSGSNLTYTITYGNTGGAAASSVVINDPLPAGTTFVSATGGGAFASGVVTWNIGTVNAGVTGQTVSFTVNVTAASGSVDNTGYTIQATGVAPIPGPPVFTTIGGAAANLTITKAAPGTVVTGTNLTYTITYGNTGSAAATSVVISDTVPAGTTFVSATNGGTLSAGVVSWTVGTVGAGVTGQTVAFTVNVTAASGTVTNGTYQVQAGTSPPVTGTAVNTTVQGAPPAAVPTLGRAGVLVLALLLAVVAVGALRRTLTA